MANLKDADEYDVVIEMVKLVTLIFNETLISLFNQILLDASSEDQPPLWTNEKWSVRQDST